MPREPKNIERPARVTAPSGEGSRPFTRGRRRRGAAYDFVEIREELDRLAQEVPNVPTAVFIKTQRDLSADGRIATE